MPTEIEDSPPPEVGEVVAVSARTFAPGLRHTDVPEVFRERIQMAEFLASAGSMVPKDLRGDPGAVMAVMLWASALDIGMAVAMREMFVVDGAVGMTAALMDGLIKRAGHDIRIVDETPQRCVVQLLRCDDDRSDRIESFTLQEAAEAGLLHKLNWQKYRKDMLYARALGRLARRHAREAVLGFGYTRDELESPVRSEAVRDTSAIEAAVEELRISATSEDATYDDLVELGRTARQDALLRQFTSDGEQVQEMLMRRLKDVGKPVEGSTEQDAPDPDVLACGCVGLEVVKNGNHREGCPERRRSNR